MKKIKIAFLISNFRRGGAETQFWNLVNGLDRDQFEVHVIMIANRKRIPTTSDVANAHAAVIKARFQLDPVAVFELTRYIRRNQIDLLQSILFMDNQFARVAGVLSSTPVVTSIRGELRPILGAVKTAVEFRMQRLSDRIVVNSEWLRQEIIRDGGCRSKLKVIYNGINTSSLMCSAEKMELRKKYGIPQESRVVGIVARLHEMKDHTTYLDALARLVKSVPNVLGLIIGAGPAERTIREHLLTLNIKSNVIFVGEVKQGIGDWYRLLDVLTLTSQWGESFPNVILEAMACDVPVVATDISAVREIITDGENGFVVPVGRTEAIANKVQTLLGDESVKGEFVQYGRKTVERFSNRRMLDSFAGLYFDVVKV